MASAAPTRKTLRRLSSAISDIWAAPADPDRWGLILPESLKSGGKRAFADSSKRDGAPIGSDLPRGLQVLLKSTPELPLEVAKMAF